MTLYAPDRALLRDVFRHAHKNGWSRVRDKDTVATWWDYDGGSAVTLEAFEASSGRTDLVLDINGMTRIDVVSLKFAVDVLVAVGLLPVEMSSQYQAGAASVSGCVCGHHHAGKSCDGDSCTCTSYAGVQRD